ncbi:MAG: hypothetical protein KAR42_04855 [candidate division Zixibacteria bacterium]|nr:hypothetical protein [candidate division Zixibacteria bacterium]
MNSLDYYKLKYSLQDDPILKADELLRMDERLKVFKQKTATGEMRIMELDDFQRAICKVQLIPPVPSNVKTVFDGAKRLFIFGYFEYYFFNISLHYLFLAVESALRNKHITLFGESEHFIKLGKAIHDLVKKGVIHNDDKPLYDNALKLRNAMSHLTQLTILPASQVLFERTAQSINQLYDKKGMNY